MAQLKTFLVVNPQSANGATGRRFERIRAAVQGAIGPVEHAFTAGPMDAAALARAALARDFDCVVAVGGDGTLNEVVNGFFDGEAAVRPGAALGIIPCGTGGDFRRSFGWGADLESAARRLRGEGTARVDVGRVEFLDAGGVPRARCFLNVASAGVSGCVDDEVNRTTKALGGRVSFVLGTFKAMLRHKDSRLLMAVDGGAPRELFATMVAVANGQYFGGGMWVAPSARPDDGVFDVTVWSGMKLSDFVLKGRRLYDGGHVKLATTQCFKAHRLSLEPLEPDEIVLLDLDGEQPGRLPAKFSILPGALRLKVGG